MLNWFKKKPVQTTEEQEEEVARTFFNGKVYMNDGSIVEVIACKYNKNNGDFITFLNHKDVEFLNIKRNEVKILDVGTGYQEGALGDGEQYRYKIVCPSEKPEFKPKRNRLKEVEA